MGVTKITVAVWAVGLMLAGMAGAQVVPPPKTQGSGTPGASAPGGNVTPPVLEHGQVAIPVDPKLTPAEKNDILASEDQIFHFVSKDTGLPIQRPVKCVFVSRDALNLDLHRRLDDDKSSKRMERSELVLKKFGLLDQDFHLRPFLLSMLTEQIEGYYDSKTKQMTLSDWVNLDEQKRVMAHELTHALQDQHIGLEKWEDPEPEGMSENVAEDNEHIRTDEAGTAREAVLEGQAMVTYADYALDSMSQKGQTVLDRPDLVDKLILGSGDQSDSPVLAKAPLVLQQTVLFPYTSGIQFEYQVLKLGGKEKAFSGVLDAPPNTSAEIMHPAVYMHKVAEPILRLPDIHPMLTAVGWEPYDVGVMGELDVRMTAELFGGKQLADKLAPHWAGGIYYAAQKTAATAVDKQTTKSVAILYLQRFKDADAATEFFGVFEQELPRQYPRLERRNADETDEGERVYTTGEGDVLLKLKGSEVWVSEGFDLTLAHALREAVETANPRGVGPVMSAEAEGQGARVEGQGLIGGLGRWMSSFGVLKVAVRF